MFRKQKPQYKRLLLFILTLTVLCSTSTQLRGNGQEINSNAINTFLLAKPTSVYQSDHFNMSLKVINTHIEPLLNVSVNIKFSDDIQVLNTSVPGFMVENDSTEINYEYGTLDDRVNTSFIFTVVFNVTTSSQKDLRINGANVSFQLIDGRSDFVISNAISISLDGVRTDPDATILRELPSGKTVPDDLLIIFAYIFPIGMFGLAIFILRRLRR